MKRQRSLGTQRRSALAAAAAVVTLILPVEFAPAASKFWKSAVTAGNWSTGSNWSATSVSGTDNAGAPVPGDTIVIEHADSASRTIALDVTSSVSNLQLGNSGLGTNALVQSSAFNLSVTNEQVAGGGNDKAVHTQSAGNNNYSATLHLGYQPGANGTYNLSGTGSVSVAGGLSNGITLGNNGGTGTFNHGGGSVTLGAPGGGFFDSAELHLADDPTSIGNYYLNNAAANLTVYGSELIGAYGTGVMNHSAGVNQNATYVMIGTYPGSNGTYNLSSSGTLSAAAMYVGGYTGGAGGNGVFNMTGGSATLSGALKVYNNGTTGVTFAGGMLSIPSLDTSGNSSRFNWTGGTLGITGTGGMTITASGQLGATLNLTATKLLNVSNALTISADGTANVQSGVLTAGTLALSGTLSGAGTVNSLVTANSGASIRPGNGGAGTMAIGGLTLSAGSSIVLDAGDRIDVTAPNAFNISGGVDVFVASAARGSVPIISYAGTLGGTPSNLHIDAPIPFGFQLSIAHDSVNKTINLVGKELVALDTLAVTGQTAPGGGTYTDMNAAFLNSAAQMAFTGTVGVIGPVNNIYRKQNGVVTPLVTAGIVAPDSYGSTNGTISTVNLLGAQNDLGQVAFIAAVSGTSNGSTSGIFRRDVSGTIKSIARLKDIDSIPGQFDNGFDNLFFRGMNNSGQIAFLGHGGGTYAIYRHDGTSWTLIGYNGGTAPGGGTYVDFGSSLLGISDTGQVAYSVGLTGSAISGGVFRWTAPSTSVLIARDGSPSPGGGTYDSVSLLTQRPINASGQVAFRGSFTSTGGIFRSDGATTVSIMRTLDPAPGGGTYAGVLRPLELLDNGSVVFLSDLSGGAGTGVYRADGVTGIRIAHIGDPAPGPGGGSISTNGGSLGGPFNAVSGLQTGQVIFEALLTGTTGGTTDNKGLFIGDGTEVIALARKGQTINGVTISDFTWGGYPSKNAFGQAGIRATLADGTTDSYVLTPALHWRSTAGGNWDTSTNWTVGLAPAFVHDVIIDPASSLTVTGPASSKVVNSLQIGSGGAAATLSLGGNTVVLHSLTTLTIDAAGGSKLDLRDSKLIVGGSPVGSWNGSAYTDVTGLIASGRNGGALPLWDGSGIVTSQSNATSGNFHSIGVARASDVRPATATATALWAGQTITGIDTLVMYTYGGDATLDGKINIDDYVKIDSGIAGGYIGWSNGDFNYDGKVSIDDYITVIDVNIGNQNGIFPTAGGIEGVSVAAVPEPGGMGIVGLLVIGCARRMRRRGRGY